MELHEVVRVLRKHMIFIAMLAVLGMAGAAGASLMQTPVFRAQATLFVSAASTTTNADLNQGSTFTQQRVKSYVDVIASPLILTPVIEELGLSESPKRLASRVKAKAPPDKVILQITVDDTDPERATLIANTVAKHFQQAIGTLESPSASGAAPVRISVIDPASRPGAPVKPNIPRNLALGLLFGIACGITGGFIREQLDSSVRNEGDVRQITDVSVLGGISRDEKGARELIYNERAGSPRSEAYRQLRTNLQFVDITNKSQCFVITSSIPGEGKTTTACNLAIALAQAGANVCLVDSDLRRPKIAEYLKVTGSVGLTSVLVGRADLADVLQPWGGIPLSVLPSGAIPPNPSELLGSAKMEALIADLQQQFDVVLFDAPPLLPVTDAAVLSTLAGGAILVIGSGRVHREQLRRALGLLEAVGSRAVGIILNLLPERGPDAYHYGYGRYNYQGATPGVRDPDQRKGITILRNAK